MVARNELLEHAEYVGNCYGTPEKPVDEALNLGYDILLDIEVQGAMQVKAPIAQKAVKKPTVKSGGDLRCGKSGK